MVVEKFSWYILVPWGVPRVPGQTHGTHGQHRLDDAVHFSRGPDETIEMSHWHSCGARKKYGDTNDFSTPNWAKHLTGLETKAGSEAELLSPQLRKESSNKVEGL